MRIGINDGLRVNTPEEWIERIREFGCGAAVFPLDCDASPEEIRGYAEAAERNGVVIGEVGIWKNALSLNEEERRSVLEYSKRELAMAEEVGARCCVNISGARGEIWDAYYPENYEAGTYELVVDTVREIIDAVKPVRTFFTLEPMPWMYPDSPENYLQLIRDVDRPAFGVHLDYANMISGMDKFLGNAAFIRHCFELLGPHIKSVHAKDLAVGRTMPASIGEVVPSKGEIDYVTVFREAAKLGGDICVFSEHLKTLEEYRVAVAYMKQKAGEAGVTLTAI